MFPKSLVLIVWVIVSVGVAGACTDLREAPHSRWQTVVEDGVHWLVTPCGERFFSIGVNASEGGYPQRFPDKRIAYHWGTFYPDLEAWAQEARQRLLSWGFNTTGGWSLHPIMLPLPTTPYLELGRQSRFHWFDPLHPSTAERMRAWARRLVAPYKGNPYRIGYFTDNEVGWWNGALFVYYVKQPATNHTKQRLIALLRDHYRRRLGAVYARLRATSRHCFLSAACCTMSGPGRSCVLVARGFTSCGSGLGLSLATTISLAS